MLTKNEMEDMQVGLVFSGVLNFIMVIIFFIMASNIAKIKKLVEHKETNINYSKCFEIGELKEFQSKKAEALDSYMEAFFYVNKFIAKNPGSSQEIKNRETIKAKIISLGGNVPN